MTEKEMDRMIIAMQKYLKQLQRFKAHAKRGKEIRGLLYSRNHRQLSGDLIKAIDPVMAQFEQPEDPEILNLKMKLSNAVKILASVGWLDMRYCYEAIVAYGLADALIASVMTEKQHEINPAQGFGSMFARAYCLHQATRSSFDHRHTDHPVFGDLAKDEIQKAAGVRERVASESRRGVSIVINKIPQLKSLLQ